LRHPCQLQPAAAAAVEDNPPPPATTDPAVDQGTANAPGHPHPAPPPPPVQAQAATQRWPQLHQGGRGAPRLNSAKMQGSTCQALSPHQSTSSSMPSTATTHAQEQCAAPRWPGRRGCHMATPLADLLTTHYAVPKGKVGRRFLATLTQEFQGVKTRTWNSELPLNSTDDPRRPAGKGHSQAPPAPDGPLDPRQLHPLGGRHRDGGAEPSWHASGSR
jgi:hypothetical protein